jgi:methylenetetrahydrofolate dehydrogenase (NADP+)/methenyltetrahydrofolate cyclohydrolase
MTKIISGKDLAKDLKLNIKEELNVLYQNNRNAKLSVILVGEDPASQSYVKGKSKACCEVGIINETILLPADITEEALLQKIDELNHDDSVDGILVQLPLPKHINESRVIEAVDVLKDVDGFHSRNVASLFQHKNCIIPCTPKGIIKLIEKAGISIEGKNAVVIGRSQIVGLPVAKLLLDKNATVTIAHSRTKDLRSVTKHADILVVAVGRPKMIDKSYCKHNQCVIDVGVNRVDGKLCGDCDFDSLNGYVKVLTKVPGGVGPMTIACLMENTLELYKKHLGL